MATRSTISVKHKDGTVSSIYCHWDGYPSHQAPILLVHYNSLELAEQLVSGGSLSYLAEKIEPINGEVHTFENPQEDVCVYYGRDRGEMGIDTTIYHPEVFEIMLDRQEYNYYYVSGEWLLLDSNERLTELLK